MNTRGESFFPLTQSHMCIRPVIAIACLLALAPPVARSFAQEGTEITVTVPPADADSKARPLAVQCWLPADCKYVRGIVVAHPMIKDVATAPLFRKVAVDESLGMICSGDVGGRTGKESMERLDKVFDEWARQSGHPEIRGAAVFTAGLSASTLWARNVGYGAPDRVFGILNVSGGNMHHVMVDERKTLSGVPFLAISGQYDKFGPEGGVRPHLEFETQWYMWADSLIERRKADPNNLMSKIVAPVKGHTAWTHELAALFLRKAAQHRLPKEKRDGSTPARCVALRAEDGWLTDRNVKHPRYEPASWAEYKGDKTEAFWHFDKEMALAVSQYHKDGIRPGQARTLFRPAGLMETFWPLGERMDIPFKEHGPEPYAAAIREWISKKTGGKLSAGTAGFLAEGIARGLKKEKDREAVDEWTCHHQCQVVCHAYDDHYRPIEEAIEKAGLPAESKAMLRALYGEQILVLWTNGRVKPDLPVRAIQTLIASLPAGAVPAAVKAALEPGSAARRAALVRLYGAATEPRPANLDKLLAELDGKDAKQAWAAADELAKVGAPAIPDLVCLMDYAGPKQDMRAAAALGKMGKAAVMAVPDLQRSSLRGDFSEDYGAMSFTALEAIEKIAKDAEQPGARAPSAAGVPRIVRATFFGTAENDDIQGVCVAADGTFYVAGNMGKSFEAVPGGAKALRMGSEASDPKCGHGYVAHFSADGGRILEYVELARGVAIMTSVQVTSNGVYVSGYASEAMEPLIGKLGGLLPKYPLVEEMRLVREGKIVEANGMYRAVEVRDETGRTNKVWEIAKADPCTQPVGLCRRGAPFVLRFSEDLQTLKGGTYLEGWQTVWVKQRQAQNGGYAGKGLMSEFFWQPTHIAALSTGDLVVCHDGGYFRILTDADRKHAGDNKYLLHHIGFYDVPDYLSRLSPDLSSRVFVSKIYTPATDKAVASRIRKYDWPYPHMSSPRTLGLRVDCQERVYVCGWSASLTSREPWWSPYIWQMSSADGALIQKLEETDPMSGKDNRMGGAVADRAIGAVAIDGDEMVWNSYSDGGWNGVIHFSGSIGRRNLESGEKIGGSRVGPCMWAVDMAVAPRGRTLVLGRCNGSPAVTADAWQTPVPAENPVAWVRLYDRTMAFSFSTVLRGVVPYKIAALGKDRYAVVGEATLETPVLKDPIQDKPQGKADGYLMVLEWKPGTAGAAPAETDRK